mgnify:FL=1|jgi:hypothetical protein
MICTTITVRGDGVSYDNFSSADWVSEVVGEGMGILNGIPEAVGNEWINDGVAVDETDEGMVFTWCSNRPYDFVQGFACNFPYLETRAVYLEEDSQFVGVSVHKGSLMAQKFDDFLECQLPFSAQPYDRGAVVRVRERVIAGLFRDADIKLDLLVRKYDSLNRVI